MQSELHDLQETSEVEKKKKNHFKEQNMHSKLHINSSIYITSFTFYDLEYARPVGLL